MNKRTLNNNNAVVFDFVGKSAQETIGLFDTDIENGLSQFEAKKRLEKYGFNELATETVTWFEILWRQFKSPFLYLLLGAAILALLLGEIVDSALIFIFITINTSIGFYQEYRSDKSLKLLRSYIATKDIVKRDGKAIKVDTREIVPGDIVLLKSGDLVPADLRLCQTDALQVDESVLTGESVPVYKREKKIDENIKEYHLAKNMVFNGTSILSGSGVGVVVAIGNKSAIGRIVGLTKGFVKESEFAKGLGGFSKFILRLVAITMIIVFAINILIKRGATDTVDLLIFSIALAISVIPEALPVVSVFSLSKGAISLAKKEVVVKRLTAIEDLGGINILCTDKTGTLTENILKVSEFNSLSDNKALLFKANLANQTAGDEKGDDAFDRALFLALNKDDVKKLTSYPILKEIPFDPFRKRNTVLVKIGRKFVLITKGEPGEILTLCNHKNNQNRNYWPWVVEKGKQGKRVLAVASKDFLEEPVNLLKAEENLSLEGFISFEDKIKPTTFSAIKKAKDLGVQVKILTGDAPEVAGQVAKEIGLIEDPGKVITGIDFVNRSVDKQHQLIEEYSVFARVSPEQKYHIVSLLQEKNSVGFLGEGINDVPALKVAGVSIVVQSAADIARESSDIVILQKSLNVIIDGIKEGRAIFSNTLKYIRATLASNFGNFYAVAISSLFIEFLPMLPVQILLVNLLTDFPMISIATDNIDEEEIVSPQRYNIRDIALVATLLGIVSSVFDFIFFALYFKISPAVLQTNWFVASILTELAFLFSIRTKRSVFSSNRPSNGIIMFSLIALAVTIALPYTQFGQLVFRFHPIAFSHLITIIVIVAIYFVVSEMVKLSYYRFLRDRKTKNNSLINKIRH